MDIQPLETSPTNASMATSAISGMTADSAISEATKTSEATAATENSATTENFPTTNNSVVPKEEKRKRSPIDGYQDLPVVSLEEATEKLIPLFSNLKEYVAKAKRECKKDLNGLTVDESAAIYLYTMASPFIYFINEAFQIATRATLEPWYSYLKLFVTAVEKLPSMKKTIWRGLSSDDVLDYPCGTTCTWWNITSCSVNVKMAQHCLIQDIGTVFAIDALNARDISKFSAFPDEEEVVLVPGTRLTFVGDPFFFKNTFSIVHLAEQDDTSAKQST